MRVVAMTCFKTVWKRAHSAGVGKEQGFYNALRLVSQGKKE